MEMNRDFAREIFKVLKEVIGEGRHASSAISDALSSNSGWSNRQRALFTNTIYDLIRWWRFLWASLAKDPSLKERDLWHLMGAYMIKIDDPVPNRPEYKGMGQVRVKGRMERIKKKRSIRESIPEALDRLGKKEIGEGWDDLIHALNTYAPLAVRTNTLKIEKKDLKGSLKEDGYDSYEVEWAPDSLVLKKKGNIFKTKSFSRGLFEVQDPASQTIAPFVQAEPKMRVIDACAGQGGKTLHLCCLMKNKGQIISMDDTEWKLDELMKRAKRAGAANIRTIHVTGSKSYKRMKGTADRVLLDVPCTGLGSLRRNPDIKWSFDLKTLERLKDLQREIMNSYSPLVKEGGKLVYATCSILPSEGEDQVEWFLDAHEGWELEKDKRLRPDREGFDGFYMARFIRSSSPA